MIANKYKITSHAVERTKERIVRCAAMSLTESRAWLSGQLETAMRIGPKHHADRELLIDGGIAIVNGRVVVTVLTDAMFNTRMEKASHKPIGGRHQPAKTPGWLQAALSKIKSEKETSCRSN